MLAAVVLCLVASSVAVHFEVQDGVYVALDDTLDHLVTTTPLVLVEFYAPWCGHCKQLTPEYAKAAKQLSDLDNVKLAKVDATTETKLAEQYHIQGYPTLKWFRNGVPTEYTGGRTTADIVGWIRKKAGPASTELPTLDAAETFAANNDAFVFGSFSSSEDAKLKTFLDAAALGELVYAHTFDAAVAAKLGVAAGTAAILKKFDDPITAYAGEWEAPALDKFFQSNSLPLVNEFSDKTAQKIFGGSVKTHLLLFLDQTAESSKDVVATFKAAASKFRGEYLFVTIDASVEEHGRIMEFFGLKAADTPAIRLIDMTKDMAKFEYTGDITTDNIVAFLTSHKDGSIKRHFMSEAVPADWDAKPVKTLVGNNFADVALNPNKNVLVKFYAPWCGHCKDLIPTWESLAEKFDGVNDVVIAKIDSTANEVPDISIQSFPTIKFFPKGDKSNVVDYSGERTLAGFTSFLEQHTSGADDSAHEEL